MDCSRRRRPDASPAARRLSARHLPLVLARAADPVVVPDPRAVLFPGELRVSRSLAKSLRNRGYVTRA